MPISVLQEKSAQSTTAASVTVTIAGITPGSVLVVTGQVGGATTLAFSDQHGDAYTDCGKGIVNFNLSNSLFGAFFNPTAGTTTVTATFTVGTPNFGEIVIWEVAGLTSASFDKVVEATAISGTAMSSGSTGTLSSATEIGLSYIPSDNGANANSGGVGWTADEGGTGVSADGSYVQHDIVSSTAALTATATQSATGSWGAWCVTLQGASGPTLGQPMLKFFI